jgi:hypothetical protein
MEFLSSPIVYVTGPSTRCIEGLKTMTIYLGLLLEWKCFKLESVSRFLIFQNDHAGRLLVAYQGQQREQ